MLLKHTNSRWKVFVEKKWRGSKLLEDECYREMYFRMGRENEDKLAKFREKFNKKHESELSLKPEKKARYAYLGEKVKVPDGRKTTKEETL